MSGVPPEADQVSGFRIQVSGFRCQDSGFRCQVSGVRGEKQRSRNLSKIPSEAKRQRGTLKPQSLPNHRTFQDFPYFFVGMSVLRIIETNPPGHSLCLFWSDWRKVCATSAAVGGGAPGPPEAGTGRGRLPPHTDAPEVTRP